MDGQLGERPGRYQVPSLEGVENVSKWGFVALDTTLV